MFVQLTADLFPAIIGGVLLAAVLSAIMSTVDSQLLTASSSVVHDVGTHSPHSTKEHTVGEYLNDRRD